MGRLGAEFAPILKAPPVCCSGVEGTKGMAGVAAGLPAMAPKVGALAVRPRVPVLAALPAPNAGVVAPEIPYQTVKGFAVAYISCLIMNKDCELGFNILCHL